MSNSAESGAAVRSPRILALTGFMACGKSTAGRSLARLLRWPFVDLDYEVERRTGSTIAEIFVAHGEPRFRELEAEALRVLLESTTGPLIVALGGGTFIEPQNAELLRRCGAHVVFLKVSVEKLWERCRAASERPPYNSRPLAQNEDAVVALHKQRLALYERADLVVDAEERTPEQIAHHIAHSLRLRIAGGPH